jgi:hypothetical protein
LSHFGFVWDIETQNVVKRWNKVNTNVVRTNDIVIDAAEQLLQENAVRTNF